ncbi:glycosyltransferase [Campylobacter concisus]|uniref:glycosyltransferase n=1 Tax=Campylobacter concisus TaxID=199 RepID=UPI000CD97557|nr:glycosyltransferase [Campylobacter concisus]
MKRVSIFIPAFESGGVENNVILYIKIFIENGYDVDVIYNRFMRDNFFKISNMVRKIKIGTNFKIPFFHSRIADILNMFIPYFLYLFKNKDQIFVFSFQSSLLPIIFCKILGIKIIVRVASHPQIMINDQYLISKISYMFKKIIYKYATLVISNSKLSSDQLSLDLGINVETIYNPVFNKEIILKSKEPIIDNIFLNLVGKKIIAVGRLVDIKDFQTLIKAFFMAQKKISCSLTILGDGCKKNELLELVEEFGIQDKVYFAGYIKNPYNYITHSDLFVLSSKNEGLPNSLIEAVVLGTPVVSTNCLSGPSEILLDGKGGDLVNVGDSYQMSQAMVRNLTDCDYAFKKHDIAYKNIHRFSYNNVMNEILNMVKKYV